MPGNPRKCYSKASKTTKSGRRPWTSPGLVFKSNLNSFQMKPTDVIFGPEPSKRFRVGTPVRVGKKHRVRVLSNMYTTRYNSITTDLAILKGLGDKFSYKK